MMLVRLNTRHELPQIAIRQTQGRLDESGIIQPQMHGTNRQARSNKTVTQPSLSVNNYPSRRAYGHRTIGAAYPPLAPPRPNTRRKVGIKHLTRQNEATMLFKRQDQKYFQTIKRGWFSALTQSPTRKCKGDPIKLSGSPISVIFRLILKPHQAQEFVTRRAVFKLIFKMKALSVIGFLTTPTTFTPEFKI